MNCPKCQYALTAFDKSCPRCNHMKTAQPELAVATAPRAYPTEYAPQLSNNCVSCGSPSIQKVSGLYQGGVWSAEAVGVGVGYGRTSNGQSFTTVSTSHATSAGGTSLAQALAPPMKPHSFQTKPEIICLTGIFVAFLAWLWCYMALAGSTASFILHSNLIRYVFIASALTLVPVISAPYAIKASRKQKTHLAVLLRRWKTVISHWDQLYYCSRCDQVFNPHTGQHVPSRATNGTLYQDILHGTNTL